MWIFKKILSGFLREFGWSLFYTLFEKVGITNLSSVVLMGILSTVVAYISQATWQESLLLGVVIFAVGLCLAAWLSRKNSVYMVSGKGLGFQEIRHGNGKVFEDCYILVKNDLNVGIDDYEIYIEFYSIEIGRPPKLENEKISSTIRIEKKGHKFVKIASYDPKPKESEDAIFTIEINIDSWSWKNIIPENQSHVVTLFLRNKNKTLHTITCVLKADAGRLELNEI